MKGRHAEHRVNKVTQNNAAQHAAKPELDHKTKTKKKRAHGGPAMHGGSAKHRLDRPHRRSSTAKR
jgi:hypothetical protein